MSELPGIVVTGASGKMGQSLIAAILASNKCRLVGALERPGHDWIGRDAGGGIMITDDPLEVFAVAQAVVDFTAPAATVGFAALAAQARAVHVFGTTGLSQADLT